jgi:hypothetical protein
MEEVADWLEKLGMSEYTQSFAEHKIDVSVLRDLTDQDLKDIGMPPRLRQATSGSLREDRWGGLLHLRGRLSTLRSQNSSKAGGCLRKKSQQFRK